MADQQTNDTGQSNFTEIVSLLRQEESLLSGPPPKRKRTLSQFVPKDTWTHEFFCLADRHQNYQLTQGQKCDLQLARLGRKVFKKDGSASALVAKLEEYFPKFQNCGGFRNPS
ncbi:Hypothetical predicted protein [Paramuricea clavata]|uniref:Uncharacterized protein n=1 Tax=Paramuricea clavata TaxID=317549 RepID=A0A7D9HZJ2_PARCT|nr:Hypothetical predicted protein [Paramuricea clavata]